ncbi:hypothetical protein HDK77DRAFT_80016 [Phyllosticta capitalensis]|uniref:Uncharacterized protein n=1 Tax=Phyllosticta capitalensis TaxID=121624 RepID=A0ABR1YD53_9PEZI
MQTTIAGRTKHPKACLLTPTSSLVVAASARGHDTSEQEQHRGHSCRILRTPTPMTSRSFWTQPATIITAWTSRRSSPPPCSPSAPLRHPIGHHSRSLLPSWRLVYAWARHTITMPQQAAEETSTPPRLWCQSGLQHTASVQIIKSRRGLQRAFTHSCTALELTFLSIAAHSSCDAAQTADKLPSKSSHARLIYGFANLIALQHVSYRRRVQHLACQTAIPPCCASPTQHHATTVTTSCPFTTRTFSPRQQPLYPPKPIALSTCPMRKRNSSSRPRTPSPATSHPCASFNPHPQIDSRSTSAVTLRGRRRVRSPTTYPTGVVQRIHHLASLDPSARSGAI